MHPVLPILSVMPHEDRGEFGSTDLRNSVMLPACHFRYVPAGGRTTDMAGRAGRSGRRKTRPPSTKHTLFIPETLTPSVKADAERRGLTLQDYVLGAVLAQLGLDRDVQGVLPLHDAA